MTRGGGRAGEGLTPAQSEEGAGPQHPLGLTLGPLSSLQFCGSPAALPGLQATGGASCLPSVTPPSGTVPREATRAPRSFCMTSPPRKARRQPFIAICSYVFSSLLSDMQQALSTYLLELRLDQHTGSMPGREHAVGTQPTSLPSHGCVQLAPSLSHFTEQGAEAQWWGEGSDPGLPEPRRISTRFSAFSPGLVAAGVKEAP